MSKILDEAAFYKDSIIKTPHPMLKKQKSPYSMPVRLKKRSLLTSRNCLNPLNKLPGL